MYTEDKSIASETIDAECLWHAASSGGLITPDGSADIIFKFYKQSLQSAYMIGPSTSSFRSAYNKDIEFIGLRIKPGRFKNSTGISAIEFTDKRVSLRDLPGDEWRFLIEEIAAESTIVDRLNTLRKFFISKSRTNSLGDSRIEIFETVFNQASLLTVRDLADDLGVSRQYLRRFFLENAGLSPRQFISIGRFKRVRDEMREIGWTSCNEEFFDQSHLLREFKKWTGTTPLNYYQNEILKGKLCSQEYQ